MISRKILHRGAAAKATHYYTDQEDDYYSRDGGAARWHGRGAAALGLSGDVNPDDFRAALRGEFGNDIALSKSVRSDARARAGLDLTFSAPKSVTLQALIAKDPAVIAAHDRAVEAALLHLENHYVLARQRVDGQVRVERTDNIVAATWRHETSRPAKDAPPDPQLHTHAILMNVTRRADGTWTAMGNEEIFRARRMLDAIYMNELAHQLQAAGYSIRHEGRHIELAHITRAQIEAFSKRTAQINAELAKRNLTRLTASYGMKQALTLATRQAKAADLPRATLQATWEAQAREVGLAFSTPTHEHASGAGPATVPEPEAKASPAPQEHARPHDLGRGPDMAPDQAHLDTDADRRAPSPAPPASERPSPTGEPSSLPTAQQGDGGPAPEHESAETPTTSTTWIAEYAVNWAIRHLTEREAVMTAEALLTSALEHVAGRVSVQAVDAEVRRQIQLGRLILGEQLYREASQEFGAARSKASWAQSLVRAGETPSEAAASVRSRIARGHLVAVDPHFTTESIRKREKRILQIERVGRGQVVPVIEAERLTAEVAELPLKPGQRAATQLILGTADRVVGVQGLAGTGKSHLLAHVKALAEANGYTVRAVASYGSQVRALRDLGIEANTIASMLEARNAARLRMDERTILVVDEAGVVPSRLMERLLQRVETAGARTVLLGDTEQTKAIEAGRPFGQLQDAGMATVRMAEILRQTNPTLRQAVELAAEGKAAASLRMLPTVYQVKDDLDRYERIADRYVELAGTGGRDTLVLTGTNDSRNAINDAVHAAANISGKGHQYELLTRRDTTQAERRYARYYVEGDVIQPERSYANGLQAGQAYQIVACDVDKNTLTVKNLASSERITFNPVRATKLSVYQPLEAELSVGSWVRVTRNDAARDLVNGGRFEVVGVTPSTITIRNAARTVTLPADRPVHLDRAYATTVHSAQGLTCDDVLINSESYSRTTKTDVYYVGISRARHAAEIYTDDKSKLPAAVIRREDKTASLDIGLRRPARQQAERMKPLWEADVADPR